MNQEVSASYQQAIIHGQNTIITISTSHTIELVRVGDILYLEGKENYCKVKMTNGDFFLANQALGKMYEDLKAYSFFLCHKSYAVNMDRIKRYWRVGSVELDGGDKIPVARRRREEFKLKLNLVIEEAD